MEKEEWKERSVLEGNKVFVRKILGRNASRSYSSSSSRRHYLSKSGQVPFQWELKPGKPKHDQLLQPPSSSSFITWEQRGADDIIDHDHDDDDEQHLPKQQEIVAPITTSSSKSVFWLWKKLKRSRRLYKVILKYCSRLS